MTTQAVDTTAASVQAPAVVTTPPAGATTTPPATGTAAATPPATGSLLSAAPVVEVKPADGVTPAKAPDAATPPVDAANPVEPIKYELKAPEGWAPEAQVVDAFSKLANGLGLDNGKAQILYDTFAKLELGRAQVDAQVQQERNTKWQAEVKADAVLGKPENLQKAVAGVRWIGGSEFAQLLDETGLGNHPVAVRAFLKLGQALAEDTVAGAVGGTAAPAVNPLQQLYPSMYPKE